MQKLRLRLSWQQGGRQSGGFSAPKRRLDHWTFVNRLDYTRILGQLIVGLTRDAKEFDSEVRKRGNFDTVPFFVRALVGFPDHSNLLL